MIPELPEDLAPVSADKELLRETTLQVEKDLEMSGTGKSIKPKSVKTLFLLQERLEAVINELLNGPSHLMDSLLYRADISTKDINAALEVLPGCGYSRIFTILIIRRSLQKVLMRRRFGQG